MEKLMNSLLFIIEHNENIRIENSVKDRTFTGCFAPGAKLPDFEKGMVINMNIVELEQQKCFEFFWNEISETEQGYGLIRDNTREKNMCSIASVGYGLSAIVIGVERGWITKEEGKERVGKTLNTMYYNAQHMNGFFYHFLHMDTAKRWDKCEPSIIDTSIVLMGALSAAEYFGEDITELFDKIYRRVDWEWYRNKETNQFYMGYHEERGGFVGAWEVYSEQFMMYALAVASPTHPVHPSIYYDCPIHQGEYKEYKDIIHSHSGSLFVYQFSNAFFDFRNIRDRRGINWFENSVKATLANRQYCIDNPENRKTLHKNSWGMTACDTPYGYSGALGAPPNIGNKSHVADGTVPPCGAIGSIPFTPKESIEAMEYYYNEVPKLWGKYGFLDAYNKDVTPEWYSEIVIGIDKGISIVMIENYRSGLIWDIVGKNGYVIDALKKLEFSE